MLIAVIFFAAGMSCAFFIAGLCTAAHDAEVQSEVMDAADNWAQVANALTATGWDRVTPATVLDALTAPAQADAAAWLAE